MLSTHHNDEKLINLDRLACCRHCAYFISFNSMSAQAGLGLITDPFDLIYIIFKSFSRIS